MKTSSNAADTKWEKNQPNKQKKPPNRHKKPSQNEGHRNNPKALQAIRITYPALLVIRKHNTHNKLPQTPQLREPLLFLIDILLHWK